MFNFNRYGERIEVVTVDLYETACQCGAIVWMTTEDAAKGFLCRQCIQEAINGKGQLDRGRGSEPTGVPSTRDTSTGLEAVPD